VEAGTVEARAPAARAAAPVGPTVAIPGRRSARRAAGPAAGLARRPRLCSVAMTRTVVSILVLCLCGPVAAQTSPAYRVREHALNGGGHPVDGQVLHSTGFRMSVDAIGDAPIGPGLSSASYAMDAGFARSYPPPREIGGVVVHEDKRTVSWDPEGSVGEYLVYRGNLAVLPSDRGSCRLSDLTFQSAMLDELPDERQGYFYLVIARSRLGEDGGPGSGSGGLPRPPPVPCP
jgi:hypothetical protein